MVPIHEKIATLLEQRKLKRRDLAQALGVSPQTATDICKGRSAVTVPHLRNLVRFFRLRPDYWLDGRRLQPTRSDRLAADLGERIESLGACGLLGVDDPEALMRRIRWFVCEHRGEFLEQFGDLGADERRVLGLGEPGEGAVGLIQAWTSETTETSE